MQATWQTYRYRSTACFLRHRRKLLLWAFLLAPVASVPELLVSPALVLGDATVDHRLRVGAFCLLVGISSVWVASQRSFVASAADFAVLHSVGSSVWLRFSASLRYVVVAWPLGPVVLLVAIVGDDATRFGGVMGSFAGMAAAIGLNLFAGASRTRIDHYAANHARRRRLLVRMAMLEAVPIGNPALAARCIVAVGCGLGVVRVVEVPIDGGGILVLCLAASVVVWMVREAVESRRRETLRQAPILAVTGYGYRLCAARTASLLCLMQCQILIVGTVMPEGFLQLMSLATLVAAGGVMLGVRRFRGAPRMSDWLVVCVLVGCGMGAYLWLN